ncbi:MAG: terminase [Rhizobium sp.]|nr:terminase [Rhizobium sp.]
MLAPDATPLIRSDWSTACPDWQSRIVEGRSLVPTLPLFEVEAERALRIFKRLRVPDIIGNPTHGEACDEWVFDFVRAIFGSFDVKAKRRMIREFFLLVPKKNGKTSISAAIIVTAAILNMRPEAELLMIAPTKKIAGMAFKQAWGIIKLDKALMDLFHAQNHEKTITHRNSGAMIIIKAAEADVITGSKATYILIDETHVLAAKSKAKELFLEIRGSLASRPDGFLLQISTQSKEPPYGVFRNELDNARAVRDGRMQISLLAIIYELPPHLSRQWRDRSTWRMVNPNLNRSVDENFLIDELTKAEAAGNAELLLFASQHLNVEIGSGLGGWRAAQYWEGAALPELASLDWLIEHSEVITVGVDMGGTDDLVGLAVVGRKIASKTWYMWFHAWAVTIAAERRKSIGSHLDDFEKAGELTVFENLSEVVADVSNQIEFLYGTGKVPAEDGIGFDSWGTKTIISHLEMKGIMTKDDGGPVSGVPQGARLSSSIMTVEWRLREGELKHGGQKMMQWCVDNAKATYAGNNIKIEKAQAGTAKIDPLVAGFNGISLMDLNPLIEEPSVYETRGILEIEI